jgi:hypothetical protein
MRDLPIALLLVGVGIVIGTLYGMLLGEKLLKRSLVKAGYAEYFLDADYNKKWRMKQNETERKLSLI